MRRLATLLLTLTTALGLVLVFPSLASAHDVLQKTTPSDGQTLDRMPTRVSLQFSEPPLALGTQVLVKGPAGDVALGKTSIEGNTVVQAISTTATAGDYTVTYRITSDDGHPVTGTFAFTATASNGADDSAAAAAAGPSSTAAPGASAPAQAVAASTADDGSPLVPVLVGAVGVLVIIALVGFAVVRRRRQS